MHNPYESAHALRKSYRTKALLQCASLAVMVLALSGCVTRLPIPGAPYPSSQLLRSAAWDLAPVAELRSAFGSDLWPMTWAADDELYTAWGDGGGFDGNESSQAGGKASLGFARVTGTPAAHDKSSYRGTNIWGTLPFAQYQAQFGGKVSDLIAVDGILYAQGGLWTRANCDCRDPTQKGESNRVRTLATSSDGAQTWTLADWSSADDPGASLQFGPDYRGALDPAHIYLYFQREVTEDPTHIYLRRVKRGELAGDPASPGHFEYFTGLTAGVPQWSESQAQATPVFTDPRVPSGIHAAPTVVYNSQLGRYLLTAFHGELTGQIGIFESANPWGPWATVAYYSDWGGFNTTASEGNGMSFPAKWIGNNGTSLWAVFSGLKTSEANYFDSFNLAHLTLKTRWGMARMAPGNVAALPAGTRVTVRGSGFRLKWSVMRIAPTGEQQPPFYHGDGHRISFQVPADTVPEERIRVRLSGSRGNVVYQDYALAAQ